MEQIVAQSHELPLNDEITLQQSHRQKKEQCLQDNLKEVKNALPHKSNRRSGFVIQRYNKIRDLEADLLNKSVTTWRLNMYSKM